MRKIDLSGERFFYLTAIRRVGKNKSGQSVWECVCDCGNMKITTLGRLRGHETRSCGCLNRESHIKHGACKNKNRTPEYRSWRGMIDRCSSTSRAYAHRYIGRGIKVCDRWRTSFKNFISDMGLKPNTNMTIDRVNNDGDYEPGNCRWSTVKQQNTNRGKQMIWHGRSTTSKYKYVHFDKKNSAWKIVVPSNGKQKYIGSYTNEDVAGSLAEKYVVGAAS